MWVNKFVSTEYDNGDSGENATPGKHQLDRIDPPNKFRVHKPTNKKTSTPLIETLT